MVSGPCAFVPDRAGFLDLARRGRLAFVYRELLADSDTPVSAYAKLGRGPYSFLLESVVGGDKWAAYTFVGVRAARGRARARRRPSRCCDAATTAASASPERATVARAAALRRRYLAKLRPRCRPGCRASWAARSAGWATTSCALRAAAEHEARRPRPARALLRDHRHAGGVRQPAPHAQGRRVGRRRRRRRDPGRAYDDACARIEAVIDRLARPAPPLRPLDPALAGGGRRRRRRPSRARRTRRACAASRSTSSPATRSRSCSRSASRCRAATSIRSTSTARCG